MVEARQQLSLLLPNVAIPALTNVLLLKTEGSGICGISKTISVNTIPRCIFSFSFCRRQTSRDRAISLSCQTLPVKYFILPSAVPQTFLEKNWPQALKYSFKASYLFHYMLYVKLLIIITQPFSKADLHYAISKSCRWRQIIQSEKFN